MKNKILSILCVLVLLCSMCLVTAVPVFAAPGAVTYTPATGPVGQVIAVTGTGWSASETILAVTVGGKTATHTLVVSSGGAISGNITAPAGLSWGAKNVVITGSASGEITSAGAFTVTASANFTPITGATSTVVTVTGAGWTASDPITSVTFSTPLTAATYSLTVDGNCNLTGTITVPVGLTAGLQTIVITGTGTGAVTSTGAYTAVAPSATFSPTKGPVGTVITVTGSGWALSETISSSTGVTVGGFAAAHTLAVSATGALTGTITVPTGAAGACAIVITGSVTGIKTFAAAFTVASKTATFSPTSGPIGQVITVTGLGWTAGEAINSVTVGGATAQHTLTVSSGAALSGTITVPAGLTGGVKTIVITGAVSGAVSADIVAFTFTLVTATATFSPTSGVSGAVGQTVTVTGSGWGASEVITSIGLGTTGYVNTVSAMPTMTAAGDFPSSYTFVVPPGLTAGLKNIRITGPASGTVTFTGAFTVTTKATFAPTSGNIGSAIVVTGSGWKASEIISTSTGVTVGGIAATSAMTVAADGSITAGTITVPAGLTGGIKDIVITGSLSGAVTFANAFTVTPTVTTFTPAAGPVGTIIATTGSGWRSGESILSATVGGISATNTLVSSSTGVLTGNIIAPAGLTAGLKDIVITGASTGGVTFTNAFTGMTNTAVFAPTSGPIAQVITVTGAGWTGAEAITGVSVASTPVVTHTLVVAAGVLSGTITVPAGLTGGIKNITITGATSGAVVFTSAYTVTARALFGTTSGPVATIITMGAATDGWRGSETINNTNGVTVGGIAATNTLTVNATGVMSGTITVPSGLTGGSKDIVITGSGTGAKTYAGAFTVTASQTFTPIAGPIGTSITTTGAGWGASESIIVTTVGGLVATNTLSVSALGVLSGMIVVPVGSTLGAKNIVITGATTGANTSAGAFTVISPTAVVAPATGPVGQVCTVSGAGWFASEAITGVTMNTPGGTAVTVATFSLTVSAGGLLSGSITIPVQTTGVKDVIITGFTTGAVTFTKAYTVVSYDTINLKTGWNLVSLMLIPTNTSITAVLSGVTVISVNSYDAVTKTWSSYTPGAPSDLSTMVDGKGYWINVASDQTLSVTGTALPNPPQTPPTYSVVVGWNLIGFKSTSVSTTYATYLAGTTSVRAYGYNSTTQQYETILTTTNMVPGKGYWVSFTAAGTIYP